MPSTMKVTVNRNDLGAAVTFASRGLAKRVPVPVLRGMRLEAAGGRLTLAATDFDVTARATVGAIGYYTRPSADRGDGVVLVDGAQLAATVKSLPRGKTVRAEITSEDDTLVIRCQGSESRLSSMDMADYPQLPPMPDAVGVVASGAFKTAAARIAALAGTDYTLPVLTTVRFEFGPALTLAATDRYRLGTDTLDWTPASITDEPQFVQVPASLLAAYGKAISADGKVTVHFTAAHNADDTAGTYLPARGGFSDGQREIMFRAEFGEFPRFDKILPDGFGAHAETDAATLAGAVKRAGSALDRSAPVRLMFDAAGSVVTVLAMRDGTVASTEQVAATFDGAPLTVQYNPGYLVSLLNGVTGGARMSFNGAAKPAQVTSTDATDAYRALVMPIRIAA